MFFNISNDFMVRVSTAYDHTMLSFYGAFADKQLSDTKVSAILDNGKALSELIASFKDGAYELDETLSVVLSTWNGNKMVQLIGEFKAVRVSANLVSQIIRYGTEVRKILKENSVSAVKAEQKTSATKALAKNSASLPVDKKSAKDVPTSVVTPPAPVTFKGHGTIDAYLMDVYKINSVDAAFYAMDESAQKEYAGYLESLKRPTFAEMKAKSTPTKKSFAEMKKESGPVKTSDFKNVRDYDKAKEAVTKNAPAAAAKSVPVSYLVQIVDGGKVLQREIPFVSQADFVAQLHRKQLLSYNEAYRTPFTVQDFAITNKGYTQSHLFKDVLVKKDFIKAVK